MKKIVLTLLLALLTVILPAQAQSTQNMDTLVAETTVEELSELAYHVPDGAPIYVATRTDAGFIETLDGLAARISAQVGFPVEAPLSSELDNSISYIDDQSDFESLVRPWLGNTAAIAALSVDQFSQGAELYAFLSVTNERAAAKYLNLVIEDSGYEDDYTISEVNGGTLYAAPEDAPWHSSYWLTNNVLVISDSSYDGFQYAPTLITLADGEEYTNTLSLLPAPGYNVLAYLDVPLLLDFMGTEMDQETMTLFPDMDMQGMLNAVGPQAWGAVILEGRSLTLDFAQTVDTAAMEAAGFPVDNMTPINPDFIQYIPADAALVLQDTDLGGSILQALDMLSAMGIAIGDSIEANMPEEASDFDYYYVSETERQLAMLDEMVTFLKLSYQGLSGAPLAESIDWMTSDYAVYLGLPVTDGVASLSTGAAIAVTDAAAVENFAQGLRNILDAWGVSYEDEGGLLTISSFRELTERFMEGEDQAEAETQTLANLDVLFGYNEEVFVLGTRPGVEAALSTETGANLSDSEAYQTASRYMLPDTQMLAYIDGASLTAGFEALSDIERDFSDLALITSLIESASITANYSEDGTGMVRFVITLAD